MDILITIIGVIIVYGGCLLFAEWENKAKEQKSYIKSLQKRIDGLETILLEKEEIIERQDELLDSHINLSNE